MEDNENIAPLLERIPSTQLVSSLPLESVSAYVEVRCGDDGGLNYSKTVSKILESLGAIIQPKITPSVTHVVFKNGTQKTIEMAHKHNVHIVSVSWVDQCREEFDLVPESKYPPIYNNGNSIILGTLKKAKSIQPKTFEEVSTKRHRKSSQKKLNKHAAPQWSPVSRDIHCQPPRISEELDTSIDSKYSTTRIVLTGVGNAQESQFSKTKCMDIVFDPVITVATTHLVCGEHKPTIKVLEAIASSIWVLDISWLVDSMYAQKKLPEEKYEISKIFPGCKLSRLSKSRLFTSSGIKLYINPTQHPGVLTYEYLAKLSKMLNIEVVSSPRLATYSIGHVNKYCPGVTRQWFIMCITNWSILLIDDYML